MQAVDKTRKPVSTTSYTDDTGFDMPSILLCSFGQYNLYNFKAQFPTLLNGPYYSAHQYEDLLQHEVMNVTAPQSSNASDTGIQGAYGRTDAISYVKNKNCHPDPVVVSQNFPHLSVDKDGNCNYSTPQLLGLIRSAAYDHSNAVEKHNNVSQSRWCVMWTPYRLTLDHPPDESLPDAALDTGVASDRQLDSKSGACQLI